MCHAHLSVGVTCVTSLPHLSSIDGKINAIEQCTKDATKGSQAQSDSANTHVHLPNYARTVGSKACFGRSLSNISMTSGKITRAQADSDTQHHTKFVLANLRFSPSSAPSQTAAKSQ